MPPLDSNQRRALLALARRTVTEAARLRSLPDLTTEDPVGGPPAGAFVTLHAQGRLRGCIGRLSPGTSLAETVVTCAAAAALQDPRFPPVDSEEVHGIEIEISILSAPEPATLEGIRVGEHGLVVTRGGMRGLLLPQVGAEFRWPTQRFLEETCRKAGLDRDAWKDPAARVEMFTAEVFSEREMRAEGHTAKQAS